MSVCCLKDFLKGLREEKNGLWCDFFHVLVVGTLYQGVVNFFLFFIQGYDVING